MKAMEAVKSLEGSREEPFDFAQGRLLRRRESGMLRK